jgi:hypothetical protein
MDSLTSVILTPVITAVLLLLIPGNFRVVLRLAAILGSAARLGRPSPSSPDFMRAKRGSNSSRWCLGSPWGP